MYSIYSYQTVSYLFQDVVHQIWFKYLQHFGLAFQNAPEGSAVSMNTPFGNRDICVFGSKRSVRRKPQSKETDPDELELCSQFSKEEFYEGTVCIPSSGFLLSFRIAGTNW